MVHYFTSSDTILRQISALTDREFCEQYSLAALALLFGVLFTVFRAVVSQEPNDCGVVWTRPETESFGDADSDFLIHLYGSQQQDCVQAMYTVTSLDREEVLTVKVQLWLFERHLEHEPPGLSWPG